MRKYPIRFGKGPYVTLEEYVSLVHFILEIAGQGTCTSDWNQRPTPIAYWLGTLSVSFTTFYSYRLLFLTFLNKSNAFKQFVVFINETNVIMAIPLALLALGSIFIGYRCRDMIIGLGSTFWGHSIFVLPGAHVTFLEAEYLPWHLKMLPFIFSQIGVFFAHNLAYAALPQVPNVALRSLANAQTSFQKNIMIYLFCPIWGGNVVRVHTFFNQKWHFDDLYNRFVALRAANFGYQISFRLLDAGWIAYLGPYGISSVTRSLAIKTGNLATGFVYHYAFIILVAITLFTTFLFVWEHVLDHHALDFVFLLTFFCLSARGHREDR